MFAHRSRSGSLVSAALAATALATATPTQVPKGYAIVGTYTDVNITSTAGLFLTPLNGGPTIPVTGLPPALSTNGAYLQGAFSVSIRSSDGAVIVGTVTSPTSPTQGDMELWVLHLNGSAVIPALTQQLVLGTASAPGGAFSAPLPDGRILVYALQNGPTAGSVIPLPAGPMANHRMAIVDTSSPTPTLTLLPNPPGITGQDFPSPTIDPTGRFVYYTLSTNFHATTTTATLLRLDLVTGTECQIATWPNESAFGVVCDDDGTVYVSSTNTSTIQHFIHTLQPNGCNPATVTSSVLSSSAVLAAGLALDRKSGQFVVTSDRNRVGFSGAQLGRPSLIDPITGAVTTISPAPPGGWGLLAYGVAVSNFMDSYGAPTDGQNRYWFENFPSPSDYPYVGNAGFALQMASAPGVALASALSLSFGRGSTAVLGAEFLLDPATNVTRFVTSGPSVPYPLAIPNDVSLAGVMITAQSLHLEANNTLATSRGLELLLSLLPAPTITSITPPAAGPGVTVTVAGSNFYGGMELRVGGNLTPIASQLAETVTFLVPNGTLCDTAVSLTNLGGAAGTGVLNGTPIINTSALTGPAAGGNVFWISGQHLTNATVTFNGVLMTSILGQSATNIIGHAPPGTVGPATVVVTGPTGCQATVGYTYQ